ncbi:related to SSN8-DNA-directed RNA polymerase II holoenzyme and SRB subcomplex subunit, cyclin C homolog [Sporisorium reilianum f. sp. reilianum]|uniref:Related to SSN8-DNA-directed RNA polymerase II holoenzyme and SRB subcomplex subunit, cyclin C homolog n=1 Tax=Sporisorium reilianum f. sp. reilianum TaxID=72559 RepID=A0A2N8UNZ3_9BASI|nr:related to SSN8-DNA-directed RNA polymerase II holoenzyme and SRB subcomplex subunit, cyclin C homolog [Sporisorium reilianum f. sp. reilianum]
MSANYWASTQCNNWLLDRPQLELARKEDLQHATRLECAAIGIFFSNLLSTMCKRLNLRQRVVASANVFFRRFFSKNSYSALDPFLVCATCVYVAAKVEESPIHVKSAVAEATRTFQEVGFRGLPGDNSSLAEMEFYLVEEMEFDMIVHHAYRSLIGLFEAYGVAKESGGAVGVEVEAFGVVKGLASSEEQQASLGLSGPGETVRLAEFDEQVLQLSWFVLNDTYKTDMPLMYPPYMIALASVWLALSLHTPASEKITASLENMQHRRTQHQHKLDTLLNDPASTPADLATLSSTASVDDTAPPSQEALTFFASLNVSLPLLAEVVQQMVSGYTVQNRVAALVANGAGMVSLLERMREARRVELVGRLNG